MDFWGRWHMTLSNWLRIYVYNPLLKGLMQRYPSPKAEPYLGTIAFFVTFFLIGPQSTLPLYIYTQVKFGVTPEVNAIATLILVGTLTVLGAGALIASSGRRLRRPAEGVDR